MNGFTKARAIVESEGVYIGGWGIKYALIAEKLDGQHDSSQDRIEHATTKRDWSSAEERSLVRKLDLRVLLPCCIIYFLAYLDRVNLAAIKILRFGTPENFEDSLHLHGAQFNWAVSITYFMVTVLLIPSNLLMKTVSAKCYFPVVMILWGTIVMAIASVQNAGGLLSARFFLGIPEAGVVPACIMYFSFWYKPTERAWRLGVFNAANSLASAVSSFLAVGIDRLNGKGGLESWRWVFLLEGALPIVMALPIYFLLITFPEDSKALTDRERHIAINRFGRGATRKTDVTWDWSAFYRVMIRPSTYVFFVSYICLLIPAVAQNSFLPTILKSFAGFSAKKSNELTSSVYFTSVIPHLLFSWHSDWTRERVWHFTFCALCAVPCYAVWTYVAVRQDFSGITPLSMYGMAFLGNMVSIAQPAALAYRTSTLYGAAEQAIGGATMIAALSIASIIGPQIYPDKAAPWYQAGFSASCATLAISVVSFLSLPLWLLLEAKRRKKKTGHAMPMRAMQDAENSMVSAAGLARIRELNAIEEKAVFGKEDATRLETFNEKIEGANKI